MGYSLTIGEQKIYENEDGKLIESAEDQRNDDAPAYGEPTDYINTRWPSYSSWNDAMLFVGLYDFMYNKNNGLLRRHPGSVVITKEHKKIIDNAYEEYYKTYPNCKPGYDTGEINGQAVRLEWLKYWVDWSLENCKVPVFVNS